MFRLISPSSTTMTRICDGQFHYHRRFFCCLQVNNSQNLRSLKTLAAFLTWSPLAWMKGPRTLWSDHHHIWAPFVRPGRDNPWYLLTITPPWPVSWHRTICLLGLLTTDQGERIGEATQPEINCLNKNLRLDRLGNRCPKQTLQVTLIDLYLIYWYNQRRVCIANIFPNKEFANTSAMRIDVSLTTYYFVKTI